jgi:PPP family 3-phenylpropionic acid transporter
MLESIPFVNRLNYLYTAVFMITFAVTYFFLFSSTAVFFPYFQLFLKARGFPPSQIGVLLACAQIAGIAGPLLIGGIADRSGRYRLLLFLAILGSALFMLPLQFLSLFWVFLPFMLLIGMSFYSLIPLTDAFSNKELPDPIHQYGQVRVLGTVGFIMVSLILQFGKLIDGSSSSSILINFLVISACYAVAIGFLPKTASTTDDDHADRERSIELAKVKTLDRTFWFGLFVIFLGSLSIASYFSFVSLYAQAVLGLTNVSVLWAIAAASEIPFIFFSGFFIKRFGICRMFYFALVVIIVRLLIFALLPTIGAVIPNQLLHGITFGLFHATAVQFVNRKVKKSQIGLGMALYIAVARGGAIFIGSLIGGYIIEYLGYRALYLIFLAPAAAAILVLTVAGHRLDSDPTGVERIISKN